MKKIFRHYLKNKFNLRYKGMTFKFNLTESKIKIYEKEIECNHHKWNRISSKMKVRCSICGETKNIDYYIDIIDDYPCACQNGAQPIKANQKYGDINKMFYNTAIKGIVYIESKNLDDYVCLFNNCDNISEILFTKDYEGTKITHHMFFCCSNLKTVTIPDSVKTIAESAFAGCSNLTTIGIPDKLILIDEWAFACCSSLKEITIPDSVKTIGNYAFNGCSSLKEIIIGNSVETIGMGAFGVCSNLTAITIPNTVKSIGESGFGHCSNLETITIGNSVEIIGNYAFACCNNLTSITISYSPNEQLNDNMKSNYIKKFIEAGVETVIFYWEPSTK